MLHSIADVADEIIVTQFQMVTDLKNFAMPLETIIDTLKEIKDIPVHTFTTSSEALKFGEERAQKADGLLVVTGSLYLVGEMMTLLGI